LTTSTGSVVPLSVTLLGSLVATREAAAATVEALARMSLPSASAAMRAAAESAEAADEALLAIEVEYEELPAVLGAREAMKPGQPIVHDDPSKYDIPPRPGANTPKFWRYAGTPVPQQAPTNVNSHVYWAKGDIATGFEQADRVFEHAFVTNRVHQTYLEPHACLVWIDEEGVTHVIALNKVPFLLRRQLAEGAGLDLERVIVHGVAVGGDFGGKGIVMEVPVAYYLAKASGRPVKIVMSYLEELIAGNPRHPVTTVLRTGIKNDGTMAAVHASCYLNSGAYVGTGQGLPLISDAAGIYRTPNVRIDSYAMYTNTVTSGNFRGVGQPQVAFAMESHMAMIAREIGMDPLQFRLLNVVREGDTSPVGEAWQDIRAAETLEAAADAIGWNTPKPGPRIGRGIAISEHHAIGGQTNTTVRLERDGSATVMTAIPAQGAGLYGVLRQMVAEMITVPVEKVAVKTQSTGESAVDTGVVGGSRATHVSGNVTLKATAQLREKLLAIGAERLGCRTQDVCLEDGALVHGTRRLTLEAVASSVSPEAVTGYHDAFVDEPEVTDFCAQTAEVEVDTETGQVHVRKLVSAHDIGTVFNPTAHQGQVDGAVIQGLGYAVIEEMQLSEGRVTSSTFAEHKIPSIKDIVPLETVLLEPKPGQGPFGAKAIGEHPLSNIAPAIADAIEDAIGVRIQELPLTAEKVFKALRGELEPPRP